MTIPSNYYSTAISFTKTTDVAKAYMLDTRNSAASILSEVTNVPNAGYSTSYFWFTYAESALTTIRELSSTDQFGAAAILTSYSTLQTNVNTAAKTILAALVAGSAPFYTLSDLTPSKLNAYITSASTFQSTVVSIKNQASSLLTTVNSTKNGLPANQPTTAMYNSVVAAYTNLATSLTYITNTFDGLNTTCSSTSMNANDMKGLIQGYLDGECDEADYISIAQNYCHLQSNYAYFIYRAIYNFAKITPLS